MWTLYEVPRPQIFVGKKRDDEGADTTTLWLQTGGPDLGFDRKIRTSGVVNTVTGDVDESPFEISFTITSLLEKVPQMFRQSETRDSFNWY